MINFKQGLIVLLAIVSLVLTSVSVLADSPNYNITRVEVNDVLLQGRVLDIERTDSLSIEVELEVSADTDDVRVEAEIEGYEFGDIKDKSEIFDAEAGRTYKKTLTLEIPDDLQASKTYTLRIEASDPDNQEVIEVQLGIDEKRHFLRIFDVILRPQGSVESGKPVFATVRVENLGEKKERDIEVRVSVPQLGIVARDYINELVTEFEESITSDDDEESSASSNELMLRIPDDTKTGVYDLLVEVLYNRGHSKVVQRIPLAVEGKKVEQTPITETTIVSVDGSSKTIKSGEEVAYKVMFANMDNTQKIYSVEVLGTQLFADTRVDPGFVNVQGGKAGEIYVFLKAKDNAESKRQFFTVRAMSGNNVVKEISLTAEVKGKEISTTSWNWVRNGLYIVFIVLILVLIVMLITWGVRYSREDENYERKDENKPLEPSPSVAEGQSYYYYPKQ